MKASFMAVGAYLLALGGSLIAASPLTSSYGFIGVANSQLDAINLGLKMAFLGIVLAPIGAAVLAYGISAGRSAEEEEGPSPASTSTDLAETHTAMA